LTVVVMLFTAFCFVYITLNAFSYAGRLLTETALLYDVYFIISMFVFVA